MSTITVNWFTYREKLNPLRLVATVESCLTVRGFLRVVLWL
jgi:hypothetical protein